MNLKCSLWALEVEEEYNEVEYNVFFLMEFIIQVEDTKETTRKYFLTISEQVLTIFQNFKPVPPPTKSKQQLSINVKVITYSGHCYKAHDTMYHQSVSCLKDTYQMPHTRWILNELMMTFAPGSLSNPSPAYRCFSCIRAVS